MRHPKQDGGAEQPLIEPPTRSVSAEVSRRIAKGALGMVPLAGSVLSEVADALLPDPSAIERGRWESEIGRSVSDLHEHVDQLTAGRQAAKATISGLAATLADRLVRASVGGLRDPWLPLEEIARELGATTRDVAEAAGELEQFGLLERRTAINAPPRVRPTRFAFEQLDRQIMGWSTGEDAAALAAAILSRPGTVSTADLHASSGWPARRFNPALGLVLDLVAGAVSRALDPTY